MGNSGSSKNSNKNENGLTQNNRKETTKSYATHKSETLVTETSEKTRKIKIILTENSLNKTQNQLSTRTNEIILKGKTENGATETNRSLNNLLESLKGFCLMLQIKMGFHIGITCDFCNKKNFKGYRYKCLECSDYDLCDFCFERKRKNLNHSTSHAVLLLQDPCHNVNLESLVKAGLKGLNKIIADLKIVHKGVVCDLCSYENIKGIRFKCNVCLDYDLCFDCFVKKTPSKNHKNDHQMIATIKPIQLNIPYSEIALMEKLGNGSFGEVFRAEWKGKTIACKILKYSFIENLINNKSKENSLSFDLTFKAFKKETKVYRELCSPNILKCFGISNNFDIQLNTVKMVKDIDITELICLEFMSNGTLYDQIHKKKIQVSLRKKFSWCLSLISGLRCIHSKGLVHKDLKPDNIFLDNELELKIGDMGLAYNSEFANELYEINQRIYYLKEKITSKSDIFSTGLIINEIFTGKIHNKLIFFPILTPINEKSLYFTDVIMKCIDAAPENRPSAEAIEDYFSNFDEYFWKYIRDKKITYRKDSTNQYKDKVFDEIYNDFIKLKNF